jgi:cellulase/cellobiase CelA1
VLKAVNAQGQELSATASVMLNAINEVISQPSIDIVQPTTGTSITAGSEVNVMIDLQEASGFAYQLGDQSGQVNGTQALLTAPSSAGDYSLRVTALDANNQALTVTDEITLTVEPATTDSALRCEIGRTDTWNAGFVINDITITNTGSTSISTWSIALNFATNTTFVNGWSGQYAQSGQNVTVTNMPYNGQLAPGQSTSIGLQGEKSGEFQAPVCSAQ